MRFHASLAAAAMALLMAFRSPSGGRVCAAGTAGTDGAPRTARDGDATTPWDGAPATETQRPAREPTTVADWLRDNGTAAAAAGDGAGARWNAVAAVAAVAHTDRAVQSKNRGWVQKLTGPTRAKSSKPPAPQTPAAAAEDPDGAGPATLGRVLADVAYGTAWSVAHVSPACANDVRTYTEHLRNFTLWAAKMLDATSKGPEGLLDGNTFSFGNFDQCLSTKSKTFGIAGGYSLVDIDFRPKISVYSGFYDSDHSRDYDPLDEDKSAWEAIKPKIKENFYQRHKFQWAVCLPDTCQSEDVQQIVRDTLIPKLNRHGMEGNVTTDPLLHTSNKNIYKYSTGFYIVCAGFVIGFGLIITGTLYELIFLKYRPKSERGPMKQIMKPFSLISNLERLLKPAETDEFSVMNGFKVLAIMQVIFGHRWFLELGNPQSNPDFFYEVLHNILFGYFACTIFLETFFVISGFLSFHIITRILSEKKKLNFPSIMIYRWLRIFPVYGTLIALYIFILPYLSDGPYWRMIVYKESERCQQNWWTNILFINNYVNTDELCIIPSWYLACDMHFFIVGTLLTYVIWKWRRVGLMLLGTIFTLSTIIPAYIIIRDQHRGIVSLSPQSLHDLSKDRFFTNVYIKSHMRAMPYFIGIIAGCLYTKLKEADYQFSLKSRIFWTPTIIVLGNIIYMSSGLFFAERHEYNIFEHLMYFTVGRFVWCLIICYIIIGHGLSGLGVCVSGFLGHRIFHVLGKLVFCIYCYQEIIQLQTIGSMRTPTYQSFSLTAWRISGDVFYSLLWGFAINVMVESPFDRLQKNLVKLIAGDMFSKPNSKPNLSTEVTIENKTSA